jgi:hypothetical protein
MLEFASASKAQVDVRKKVLSGWIMSFWANWRSTAKESDGVGSQLTLLVQKPVVKLHHAEEGNKPGLNELAFV